MDEAQANSLRAKMDSLRSGSGMSEKEDNRYGALYQELVKAGHEPQLRQKYRSR